MGMKVLVCGEGLKEMGMKGIRYSSPSSFENDTTSRYSDLIRRLRATGGRGQNGPLKVEAADAIETLLKIERFDETEEARTE